jgi:two-component system chemotaxis response regulator CheB
MSGARRTASDAPGGGAGPQAGPPRERVDIVAIGVSTGGLKALSTLLADFPAALPVPIVIVQHMPPTFTRLLAERLDEKLTLRVSEAKTGERLVPGRA